MVPRRAAGWWSETTRSSVNDDTENKNTMADINTIAEELGKLTVLEASELVKKLEEDWGVSAAAPAAAHTTHVHPRIRRRRYERIARRRQRRRAGIALTDARVISAALRGVIDD